MNKRFCRAYMPDRCHELDLTSSEGLEYRILIAVPEGDPPVDGYAVAYALDGDATFQTLAETVKLQTRKPKGYDPILVVGIAYPSKEAFDLNRRCRDFTMMVDEARLPVRPDGRRWPPHGGAEAFLAFIQHELKPAVEAEWNVDEGRQLLVGHSLGGLFVLHALLNRPKLFSHYVAGSPSVWWGENEILRELETCKAKGGIDSDVRLLLTIGEDELPDMLEGADQVMLAMPSPGESGVSARRITFPDEDHVSVMAPMLGRIPRFLWEER